MLLNPYRYEQVPQPLSHEAILAEFVKHNGTVQDISGEDGSRNPRNLFAVNTDPASHTVTYPKGTGGQDLGFGASSVSALKAPFLALRMLYSQTKTGQHPTKVFGSIIRPQAHCELSSSQR
jgi:hypothetical protein